MIVMGSLLAGGALLSAFVSCCLSGSLRRVIRDLTTRLDDIDSSVLNVQSALTKRIREGRDVVVDTIHQTKDTSSSTFQYEFDLLRSHIISMR